MAAANAFLPCRLSAHPLSDRRSRRLPSPGAFVEAAQLAVVRISPDRRGDARTGVAGKPRR